MSIIEEALRRVQDPLVPKTPPSPAPAKPRVAETQPAAHSWQAEPPGADASPTQSQTAPLVAVALAVLALTAVLVIGGAFWMGRTLATTPHADRSPAQASSHAPAPAVADAKPPAEEAAPAHPERPRRAPAPVHVDPSGLVLSGIVEGLGDPYAVINGTIVAIGERVGDATLEQIAKGSVTLRHDDGRETVLRVPR